MKIPKVPKITHQQAAILSMLRLGSLSGKEIRARLIALAIKTSLPNFYQSMARLERAKYVKGFYDQTTFVGARTRRVRERRYTLQPKGMSAVRGLFEFYHFVRSQ